MTGTTTGVTGGNTGSMAMAYTATMTAPAASGTYFYKVWGQHGSTADGVSNFALYSIAVAPVVTIPPTTVPPTTVPPTTVPPTTRPPIPVDSPARILLLSPRQGTVGTEVHIAGDFFGTSGVVKFGKVTVVAASWTENIIVVNVPAAAYIGTATLTVVPTGRSASNGISFTVQGPGTPVIVDMGDLAPTALIGTQHLGMYNKYPGNCAACHDGDYRPVAPVISWLTDTDLKLGRDCSSCHSGGKKTPIFITQMSNPSIAVYGRCSSCHQYTSKH